MRLKLLLVAALVMLVTGVVSAAESAAAQQAKDDAVKTEPAAKSETTAPAAPQKLTLDECLKIALERNHRQPASKFAVEAADAQLRQVKSGYMPQFLARSTYLRQDEPGNFIFPEESSFYQVKGLDALLPQGTPPGTPIPLNVTIPEKDVKLGDRTSWVNEVGMKFPLYTGGQLEGLTRQARAGLTAAREEARKTDMQVVMDVRKAYWTCVMTHNLVTILQDTFDRMETTLDLTERLYTAGSGKVKKTDFLRNKLTVEALRSSLATMQGLEQTALSALATMMGLNWPERVIPADENLPFDKQTVSAEQMVPATLQFNPDWARLDAGLKAAEGRIRESKSGHLPKLALFGNIQAIDNDYDKGMTTPRNKHNWTIGLGMEYSLFDGNLTTQKVREARARLKKLQEEKILLREGLALMVQQYCNGVNYAQKQVSALEESAKAAVENRELNIRAYQNELVETKDVIEAQLTEAFIKAGLEKARFDRIENHLNLEFVVGRELAGLLGLEASASQGADKVQPETAKK